MSSNDKPGFWPEPGHPDWIGIIVGIVFFGLIAVAIILASL